MEYVDVLDAHGNKTGIVKERTLAKKAKDYTLGVHVWIINSENQVLLQKRSLQKHSFASMWDSTGGRARARESSVEAMKRELKEELGVDINSQEFQFLFRFPAQQNSKPMFLDVYLLKKDIALEQLTLQQEEVEAVCYISIPELKNWYYENDQFVKQPYFLTLLKRLEEEVYEREENSSRLSGYQLLYSRTKRNLSCN